MNEETVAREDRKTSTSGTAAARGLVTALACLACFGVLWLLGVRPSAPVVAAVVAAVTAGTVAAQRSRDPG